MNIRFIKWKKMLLYKVFKILINIMFQSLGKCYKLRVLDVAANELRIFPTEVSWFEQVLWYFAHMRWVRELEAVGCGKQVQGTCEVYRARGLYTVICHSRKSFSAYELVKTADDFASHWVIIFIILRTIHSWLVVPHLLLETKLGDYVFGSNIICRGPSTQFNILYWQSLGNQWA